MSKWAESKTLNRLLLAVLAPAILGAAAALIYAITAPPARDLLDPWRSFFPF